MAMNLDAFEKELKKKLDKLKNELGDIDDDS